MTSKTVSELVDGIEPMASFLPGGDYDVAAHLRLLRGINGSLSGYTADMIEKMFAALTAEREEAEAVIAPFAEVANHDIGDTETDADYFVPMIVHNRALRLTVGHLRAAAAFMAKGETDGNQ